MAVELRGVTGTDPNDRPRPPYGLLRGASLFLDFDGTLVDLAPTPGEVEVGEPLRALVAGLHDRLGGRIAIVSGRPLAEIAAFLHPVALPIGGSHGLELRLPGGSLDTPSRPEGLDKALARMHALAADWPGVLVEEKPLGAALHYRGAPQAEAACRRLAAEAADVTGLALQPGKMVFELKPAGGDKGRALGLFMADPLFAGTHPVFLGDDLTDEAGFAAAAAAGGAGILVGEARATAARFRLDGVAAARAWLTEEAEALA